ncbi:hypothetical protein J6590_097576 [Homalodisca vitripennis]|nr:hypothetical protein J6590_097576 [Homalodisca vitripennis]
MPRPSSHPAVSTTGPASDTGVVFRCQDPPHIQPCLQQGQLAIRPSSHPAVSTTRPTSDTVVVFDAKPSSHPAVSTTGPASDTVVVFRFQDPPHIQPCFPMPRHSSHPAVSTTGPASDTGVVFRCQDPPLIQPCLQQGQLAIRELFSDAKTLLTYSRVYNRASKRYGSCFPMPRPSPKPAGLGVNTNLRVERVCRPLAPDETLSQFVGEIREVARVLRLGLSETELVHVILEGIKPEELSRLVFCTRPSSFAIFKPSLHHFSRGPGRR